MVKRAKGAVVRGLRQSDIKARKILADNIERGIPRQNLQEIIQIVLGYRMARKFKSNHRR